ncbi:hypothetical protein GCM10010520_60080 [Rhizobium viscosum]|uniref:Uncharacterized protein n=1 Tax=Rhizobium viscosum TaxID=1673 RepID=A0ABR9IUQ0_RHIVS|nr:hypothetical protein [Rhizobium viscosum]MBE1506930.1 hypothetical protein [Rhizobium viscosum]
MTYASKLVFLLGLATTAVSPNPASAEGPITQRVPCAEAPDTARTDCTETGEPPAALLETSPGHGDLTVLMRAEQGALTLEYRKPSERPGEEPSVQCAAGDKITLPAGKSVQLQFISADVPYSFEIAGYVEKVDIVPGLVSYGRIDTPAGTGQADGVLRTDADGSKKVVTVRFHSGRSAFDSQMFCAP